MFEKLHRENSCQTKLPTSHYYMMRAHISKQCYEQHLSVYTFSTFDTNDLSMDSSQCLVSKDISPPSGTLFGEIFGCNRLKSSCFQVQPITCCDLSISLYQFEAYSQNSSKLIGDFLEVLNVNRLFLKLD